MSGPTMRVDELAAELGRSTDWIYSHHAELTRKRGMPAPLPAFARSAALVWSRAQIYAWLDRDLPAHLKPAAAAFRAAFAAADGARFSAGDERDIADHRDRLNRKYLGSAS